MTKEEAKAKLKKAESDLRQANIVLEMHEQGIKEIEDKIAELQAIINRPDRWQDGLVQPEKEECFYISDDNFLGLCIVSERFYGSNRKPEHAFKTEEQAELIKEKTLLMWEMHAFAHVRNEGWMPDWEDRDQTKYGIVSGGDGIMVDWCAHPNSFVFGVVVKSIEIAGEMLEEFGERIEKFYNKQY